MKTSKYHCHEGEQREILLGVFARFCRSTKGAFWSKYPISTRRSGPLKPGKLLNLIGRTGNKQDLQIFISVIFRDEDFSNIGRVFLTHPVVSADTP